MDNFLKDNLCDYMDDVSENNPRKSEIEMSNSQSQNQNVIKEEIKSLKKIPEIKIENSNTYKNSPFDMPRVNKMISNNLNHFHDDKRRIEGNLGNFLFLKTNNIKIIYFYFFNSIFYRNWNSFRRNSKSKFK